MDFQDEFHATGIVYCRAEVQEGGRESTRWIVQLIQYHDLYGRREGRWLFVRRIHELWYGVETAERPLAQDPANWPARHVGRGTLPDTLPTWGQFWAPQKT